MKRTTQIATPVAHAVGPGKLKMINGNLAFTAEGLGPVRIKPEGLRTVACYGGVSVTDEALRLLFRHGVELAFLTASGTVCWGRLVSANPSGVSLRLRQHRALGDPARKLELARTIVALKVESIAEAARHYQRHGAEGSGDVLARAARSRESADSARTVEALRGVEGSVSAAWFGLLGRWFLPPWRFTDRVRRPPTDPVNAMLSLGYTWLTTRAVAACESAGLEVYLGALHEFRAGRPSLACDLIEPLRIPAVDRWVLTFLNRKTIGPEDFETEANGGVKLRPEVFGKVLHSWETHWQSEGGMDSLDRLVEDLVRWLGKGAAPEESALELEGGIE